MRGYKLLRAIWFHFNTDIFCVLLKLMAKIIILHIVKGKNAFFVFWKLLMLLFIEVHLFLFLDIEKSTATTNNVTRFKVVVRWFYYLWIVSFPFTDNISNIFIFKSFDRNYFWLYIASLCRSPQIIFYLDTIFILFPKQLFLKFFTLKGFFLWTWLSFLVVGFN